MLFDTENSFKNTKKSVDAEDSVVEQGKIPFPPINPEEQHVTLIASQDQENDHSWLNSQM